MASPRTLRLESAALFTSSSTPSMVSARTSSKMATAMMRCPISDLSCPRSMRMRTLTGRAVIATQSPTKIAGTMAKSKAVATANPDPIGMRKAKREVIRLRPREVLAISRTSISSPAIITNKKTPNSLIAVSSSLRTMTLSTVGPRTTPARISPIIAGCLNRSITSPKTRASTKRRSRFAKKGRCSDGKSCISQI